MEKRVYEQLSKRKIEAYLPTTNVERRWHDRKKIVREPLFPGYIFVKPTSKMDFFDCQAVDGVCYFVRSENKPANVPANLIEKLKKISAKDLQVNVSDNTFQPGQSVYITSGPLAATTCEIISYKGNNKILVRLKIINRNLLLDLESDQVVLKTDLRDHPL